MNWRDRLAGLPSFAPVDFDIEPGKTGLVIIDMQYLDAHPEYGLGKSLKVNQPDVWKYYCGRLEDAVVPNTKRLLETFRHLGLRIIHVTIGPVLPDGADLLPLRRPKGSAALKSLLHSQGTFEHGILQELAPRKDELVINKTSRSVFNSTAIERVLLNLGLDTLVFAGVTTSSCVDTSARDAADRGFKCVIVEDATAELDQFSYEATLLQFAVRWGRVFTTDELFKALRVGANAGIEAKAKLGVS